MSNISLEPTPRRTQVRAIESKKAILDAALIEFGQAGFTGASLRKIGESAAVNHRLIQYHFGSKLDLWEAVAHYCFDEFEQRLERRFRSFKEVDEREMLKLIFREFILFSAAEPSFHKFIRQANGDTERIRWIVETFLTSSKHSYLSAVERAQELNLFIEGRPLLLHYIFIGAATSIFVLNNEFTLVSGENPFDETLIEEHTEIILRMFFREQE